MTATAQPDRRLAALLVDDERLARDELRYLLESFPDLDVIGEAADGVGAIESIRATSPDIVFMDVQMPGLNGLEVVRELVAAGDRLPHVVFATAYDQYAVEAFEVNAADYLLKPVEKKRLGRSIERAREVLRSPIRESERMVDLIRRVNLPSAPPTKVLVRLGARLVLVDAGDVIFATVHDGLVRIVARELEGLSNYKTLDDLQKTLGDRLFWRAHRSYLVNIDRIHEVLPWFQSSYRLSMSDRGRTEIPVSRGQTKRLRQLFRL